MDWIPALTTSGILGLLILSAIWLGRNLVLTRLTKSVQHEFDAKLEGLRSQLRTSEESFRADLREKEHEIASLQSGALAGLVSRQAELDKRRLLAVDQLWEAMTALAPAKAAVMWMATIKFEPAAKEAAKNPQFRQMFQAFSSPPEHFNSVGALSARARPHVSQIAWAIFSAYQSILLLAVAQLHVLKSGLDIPDIFDMDAANKLIKAALPHRAAYLDEYGKRVHHHLAEELELKLLEELTGMLKGFDADRDAVERAAAILKAAQEVREKTALAERSEGQKP